MQVKIHTPPTVWECSAFLQNKTRTASSGMDIRSLLAAGHILGCVSTGQLHCLLQGCACRAWLPAQPVAGMALTCTELAAWLQTLGLYDNSQTQQHISVFSMNRGGA
jgi:hypothetical protein